MKKTILIFPFKREEIAYIKYFVEGDVFEKIYLGITGGIESELKEYSLNVQKYFGKQVEIVRTWNDCIDYVDYIWITSGRYERYLSLQIEQCIQKANELCKEVYIEHDKIDEKTYGKKTDYLYRTNAILITVGEFFEESQGDVLLLEMASELKKQGVNTVCILNRNVPKIKGLYGIPQQIKSGNYDGSEKVFLWNRYLRFLDETVSPDVILIQVPGGMLHFPQKNWDDWGLKATYLFESIDPDLVFVTIPFNMIYNKEIQLAFKYRFNISVDSYFLSERIIDFSAFNRNEGIGNLYANRKQYLDVNIDSKIEKIEEKSIKKWAKKIKQDFLQDPFELVIFQL